MIDVLAIDVKIDVVDVSNPVSDFDKDIDGVDVGVRN